MDPRKLLQPWRKSFRRLRAVEDDDDDDDDVLWLDFGIYGRTNQVAGFTIEGLELLQWLARVSLNVFYELTDELWPEQESLTGQQSYRSSCCQQIGIRLRADTYSYSSGLGYTSPSLHNFTASREYVDARGVIQQVLRERHGLISDSHQKPEILVYILPRAIGSTGRVFFKTLPLIPDAMKRWLDAPNATQDHEFHLHVTTIELTGKSINTNNPKLLSHLNALATCGVKLVGGRFNPVDKTLTRAARAIFLGLGTLLQTHPCAAQPSTRGSGVWDITFKYGNDNSTIVPGLFSAITATRSVRHISVSLYAALNAIASIGLALCSSLARHSIESVTLDVYSDRELQQMIQTLRRDDDPLAVVYADQAVSIRAHQHLRATASRFTLYDPTTHAKKKNVVVNTHELTNLRIIDYKRPWWCVLLPAWDEAWVHDDDVTVTTVPTMALAQVGNPNIRKMCVRVYESTVTDVVALVTLMNPCVEDLTLFVRDPPARDDAWATVVSSFPSVRRLSLKVLPRHLAPLVSAIGSPGAQRSLTTLTLDVRSEGNELDLLRDFIANLADPSHAVSQCLDRLVLEGQLQTSADAVDELTRLFAVMLNTNKRLVTLRFVAGRTRLLAAASQALEQTLSAHNGTLASVRSGALRLCQKLAFLSTMPSASLDSELGCGRLLDSDMISLVFVFAAQCQRRTVFVRIIDNIWVP